MEVDQLDKAFQPEITDRQDALLYDFSYDDDGGNVGSPVGQVDDESNMSALDLYTDMVVRDSEEAALSMAKLKEEKTSFKAQLDAALLEVSKLTKENETLTKENKVLRSNISVLLKTAKMELQRKDRELNELREMQLDGRRPAGNALSPRSRKTRRAPKHRQQPGLLRQNGAQHPKSTKDRCITRNINKGREDSDSDKEQKPDLRETMFVRRQRAKIQHSSTGTSSQPSKLPHLSCDKPEVGGGKRSVQDALICLSQQSSHEMEKLHSETKDKEKIEPSVKDADKSRVQGTIKADSVDTFRHSAPKDSGTKMPNDVRSNLETQKGKTEEEYAHHLKEISRSKSERATRSRSVERSSAKMPDDSSRDDRQKIRPRSRSHERSSRSQADDKRSSPSRSSRSRSNDKRLSRSKSRERMLSRSRSSRSKSRERSSSRSKSHDRAEHGKSQNKPHDIKRSKEKISRTDSSSAFRSELDYKRSRSERDKLKKAESLAYKNSRTPRGSIQEKHWSSDRHKDRDRRDRRRSSTPIRDSTRKDSRRLKEDQKILSSVKVPSSSERDRRLLERGQSRARERMSSIAKESVAKAKARLNKRMSSYSSPNKSPRPEKERRRSSKVMPLDESSLKETYTREIRKDIKENDQTSRREKEKGYEGSDRKRKHRISSSLQKESERLAKKRRAGSSSDDIVRATIADEDLCDASGITPCTYEEGHTVLACGMRNSIECTSSKVTVLHTSVSDAYDTTQSEMSFLYASGLHADNGSLKEPSGNAGPGLNKEIKEEGELSEEEIVSDEEEANRTDKDKHGSSEKKRRQPSKHKHNDHHSKSKVSKKQSPKSARRGKKHKRRSSSDHEAREKKRRLKENKRSNDSIISQTEEATSLQEKKVCEDDHLGQLVSKDVFPPLSDFSDSEIAQKNSDSDSDKGNGISVSNEKSVGNHPAANNEAEAVIMTQESESPTDASRDIEDVAQTETLKSPVGEVEDNRVSTVKDKSGGERIKDFEDALESDTVGIHLRTATSPEKAIPLPVKESSCADELKTQLEAAETDANVSRGILFEDLCLSSSVDDTSYLSSAEANSENQRHSFMNSIEKVDKLIKDIQNPLLNPSALEMDNDQKSLEELGKVDTKSNINLGTTTYDQHNIPLKTITSESMPDRSKNGEKLSESVMEDAISDLIVEGGTHHGKVQKEQDIKKPLTDTSVELNISISSEPAHGNTINSCVEDILVLNDDKSESADHVSDEDNDAVSLLAASGDLDSFMQDNTLRAQKDFDFSLNESKPFLKEAAVVDKNESSLQLTCEWSNIEFQDSSTKMGTETDPAPVTVAAPIFDDGCAQDMDYAKDPLGIDTSVLDRGEHEEKGETVREDKGNELHIGGTVKGTIKKKEERKTDSSNEASEGSPGVGQSVMLSSENAPDLKSKKYSSSKVDPVDLESMDASVCDTLANGEPGGQTANQQPSRESGDRNDVEQEKLSEGIIAQQKVGKDEAHASCNAIVISDEDRAESELDFEEEEEEESVYIVDVQHANAVNSGTKQENDSFVESEEEKEELNLSDSEAPDVERERNTFKTLVSLDEPPVVGEVKGNKKAISSKGQSESDNESSLDWKSEPEDQNEIVGKKVISMNSEDKDECRSGTVGEIPDTEMKEDVSKDREEGTDKSNKEGKNQDTKEEEEKTDGDQQNLEDSEEEEGEILEEEDEEEHVGDPDKGHDRKSEKSRTDHRQRRDHEGHSHSHHHISVRRDSSRGKKDRTSATRRLDPEGRDERGRSGSSDRRLHREVQERDDRKHPKRERTGRGRTDEECSRKMKEQRHSASEKRREEDRKKAAFLVRKQEEDRRRAERRKADERREARKLENERRQHEERKRARRREEDEKVRSRLHDSEKKREPPRKSKKVSEGRKP